MADEIKIPSTSSGQVPSTVSTNSPQVDPVQPATEVETSSPTEKALPTTPDVVEPVVEEKNEEIVSTEENTGGPSLPTEPESAVEQVPVVEAPEAPLEPMEADEKTEADLDPGLRRDDNAGQAAQVEGENNPTTPDPSLSKEGINTNAGSRPLRLRAASVDEIEPGMTMQEEAENPTTPASGHPSFSKEGMNTESLPTSEKEGIDADSDSGIMVDGVMVPGFVKPTKSFMHWLQARAIAAIKSNRRKKIDRILTMFEMGNKITNDSVEKFLHVADSTAQRYLNVLVKEDKIKRIGRGPETYYVKN